MKCPNRVEIDGSRLKYECPAPGGRLSLAMVQHRAGRLDPFSVHVKRHESCPRMNVGCLYHRLPYQRSAVVTQPMFIQRELANP
jgi:hypothetical protein